MILKIIFVVVVLFLIYLIFFKKTRDKNSSNKNDRMISDEMLECPSCGTFVSQKEAILSNGRFFCSKECLNNKRA
ncbi:PP0621 family protein [Arcobacter porcinus]|uniref:PP0621 family protein n=1 Tax=Arcobacter porcinus TaxID=1935204 RepID=UPI0008250FE2|nr:PP0621 family protein [Arcobacter porcinus]OCL85634.1 Prokaryotic metallothionein [Arcobacter porcinus]